MAKYSARYFRRSHVTRSKQSCHLPSGVEVKLNGQDFSVKGSKGEMAFVIHDSVVMVQEESELKVRAKGEDKEARAMAGTMRALVQNMVTGVSEGFQKSLSCRALVTALSLKAKR